ncbi:MAG TPA: hypothetical protein PKC21_10170 [Oligoflexia bacterium]|nr:hypothetical protein [Oligoflexia bacterium]HMR25705.1 hypothetical protein [Oligoflexia bacterium]
MTYKTFIEKLRAVCICNNTVVNSAQIQSYFLQLNKADQDLIKIVDEYRYGQLPVIPVIHKEQGFELKLLQTSIDFDSEIHDHPYRDVHGYVLNGSIEMTVYNLKQEVNEDSKLIEKVSEQSYKQGDYFLIGRDKNNYHRVKSKEPAVVLELVTPAITAKLAEDTLKYQVQQVLDNNLIQVMKLEELVL